MHNLKYFIVHFRRISRLTHIFTIFLIITIISLQANSQTFTRTCQDPLVQNHINVFGHTYCFHACGDLNFGTMSAATCTANGNCICNYPCGTAAPPNQFGDVCPPSGSDPPDPDPLAASRCTQSCNSECTGGQGSICGEVQPLGPNLDVYAKICTCFCPPIPCTTTTTSTTTTTTTTTTPTPLAIALIKSPLGPLLIKKKIWVWKIVLIKLFKIGIFLFKICSLYLLKVFLLGLYYLTFYEWIQWVAEGIFGDAWWGVEQFLDFWVGSDLLNLN